MKPFIYAAFIAGALATSTASFAQDAAAPVTRAEVRADLARLEQAGYNPGVNDAQYPADIQAAEARLETQDAKAANNTAVGGLSMEGSSQSGAPTTKAGAY